MNHMPPLEADVHHRVRGDVDVHHRVRGDVDVHHRVRGDVDVHHRVRGDIDVYHRVRGDIDMNHSVGDALATLKLTFVTSCKISPLFNPTAICLPFGLQHTDGKKYFHKRATDITFNSLT